MAIYASMSMALRQLVKEKTIPKPHPHRVRNLFDILVDKPENGLNSRVAHKNWVKNHPKRNVLVRGVLFNKDMRRGRVWGQLMSNDRVIERPMQIRQTLQNWRFWKPTKSKTGN